MVGLGCSKAPDPLALGDPDDDHRPRDRPGALLCRPVRPESRTPGIDRRGGGRPGGLRRRVPGVPGPRGAGPGGRERQARVPDDHAGRGGTGPGRGPDRVRLHGHAGPPGPGAGRPGGSGHRRAPRRVGGSGHCRLPEAARPLWAPQSTPRRRARCEGGDPDPGRPPGASLRSEGAAGDRDAGLRDADRAHRDLDRVATG